MPPCGISTQIFVLFAYKIIKLMHPDVLELWQVNLIKERKFKDEKQDKKFLI